MLSGVLRLKNLWKQKHDADTKTQVSETGTSCTITWDKVLI